MNQFKIDAQRLTFTVLVEADNEAEAENLLTLI